MKKWFFDYLFNLMKENKDIYFLMAGLGYPRVSQFEHAFPSRAFNTEASEQATLDMAVGLAYSGKIVFVYSITPFLIFRGFETIRTYINRESLPIFLIGAGRGDDYSKDDGFSHFAGDDFDFLQHFANIDCFTQSDIGALSYLIKEQIKRKRPTYINLSR